MSDCCPLCHSGLQHRAGRGLELRRHPRGRLVCPHDQKRWHLNLETVQRELDLCRDEARAAHLRAEFEDMLIQHSSQNAQHADDAVQRTSQIDADIYSAALETA